MSRQLHIRPPGVELSSAATVPRVVVQATAGGPWSVGAGRRGLPSASSSMEYAGGGWPPAGRASSSPVRSKRPSACSGVRMPEVSTPAARSCKLPDISLHCVCLSRVVDRTTSEGRLMYRLLLRRFVIYGRLSKPVEEKCNTSRVQGNWCTEWPEVYFCCASGELCS